MTGDSLLRQLKRTELTSNALFFLALQLSSVGELLAIHEFRDPTQTSLDRRGRIVEVIAIEAEAHLQTQCVTCAQTNRLDTLRLTCLEDRIPDGHSIFQMEIELKTSCSRITCIRNDYLLATRKLTSREGVIGNRREIHRCQTLQYLQRLRTLDSQLTCLGGSVLQLSAHRIVAVTPCPIFVDISGIDHQKVFLRLIVINQQVINNSSRLIGEAGILCLTQRQLRGIIRGNALDKSQCIRTLHPKLTHVRDIKHTHAINNGHVLINNS